MKNVLNALDAMLEAYRKKEREFPSYDELAGLLKAPAILVSADPVENAAIARDAQAIVDADVLALPGDNAWKQFCGRVNRPAAAAPQAVADERDAWRAAGRAEALSMLMGLCPETGIDEYTGWSTSGSPEDEGCAHWNEEKLRELLHVDSALADMMSKAEAAYYDYQAQKGEAEHATAFAANMHSSGRVREVLAKAGEYELIGDLCRAAAPVQAQEPVALICTSCGTDRLKDPCPTTADHCTMAGVAHSAPVQPVAVPDDEEEDFYSHACEVLEQGQKERAKRGVEIGTQGSLCDGISWLFYRLEKLESAAPAVQGDALAEREKFEKHFGPKDNFCWRNADDTYKNGSTQQAWVVWQAAIAAKAAS